MKIRSRNSACSQSAFVVVDPVPFTGEQKDKLRLYRNFENKSVRKNVQWVELCNFLFRKQKN